MKKLTLFLIAVVIATFSQAQSNVVASAYNYHKSGMPDKAMDEIDKAILHESTMNDAKTWFYRGNIYLQLYSFAHMSDGLAQGMTDSLILLGYGEPESRRSFKKVENGQRWYYPNGFNIILSGNVYHSYEFPGEEAYKAKDNGKLLETALASYRKVIELDPKLVRYELNPASAELGIKRIAAMYYNEGVNKFSASKTTEALAAFENAAALYGELDSYDENLYLYTGYAAENLNDTNKAIKYYSILVKNKTKNENLYMKLAYLYMGKKDYTNALKVVKAGRTEASASNNLMLTEANIYLQTGRTKEAEQILKAAAEKDPNNKQLHFAIGANYDEMIRNDSTMSPEIKESVFESARQAYIKALEIDPNYFDAAYNMGAMLNNRAAALLTEANNLPMSATAKYEALSSKGSALLIEAKPYLEKCHQLDPKDRNTMIMLRGVYSQTKDYDNLKKINAELKGE